MTSRFEALTLPRAGSDFRADTPHRNVGLGLGAMGLVAVVVTLVANIAAANDVGASADTLRWTFGVTTAGLALAKLGIAVILVGILVALWHRVSAVSETLAGVKVPNEGHNTGGATTTDYRLTTATATAPGPLPVHRMAKTLWLPMLAMGFATVIAGLVLSLVSASETEDVALWSWTQGLQFLGEGMLLGGIAFLLGSILAGLRAGGGEVQEALGIPVKTLNMPTSAKVFVGLMTVGMMLAVGQFVLYVSGPAPADDPTAWFAWLGPLRELSLGLLLASIVLALSTIGSVLNFQFDRIREIIVEGR